MKFTCSVEINQPKAYVAEIFSDSSLLKHFQNGLKAKEHISGVPEEAGAKSKMIYEKLELIETIISNDLPDEFMALYEHKHMTNTMKVNFESLSENVTCYTSEIEYTKFNGLMIKFIAKLFPSMFKKQALKWMNQFKVYVEHH